MEKSDGRFYDELLNFLGDPIFQIPVRTFMDENCLIFDPSIVTGEEHHAVHSQYKKLVDTLLESFCKDTKITVDAAIGAISKMSEVSDLEQVFHVLFEQVQASTDFKVFEQVMIKRNIMIQEQVLVMIIAATGALPESMLPLEASRSQPTATSTVGADDTQEYDLLQHVMKKSAKEKKKTECMKRKEEEALQRTIQASAQEAKALQQERKHIEQSMTKLTLESTQQTKHRPSEKAGISLSNKSPEQFQLPKPSVVSGKKTQSSTDAASAWMKSAQSEATAQSTTHTAMAASMSELSPDELKSRQKYLREQRDKLLAMKKEARQQQLGNAELAQPGRPQSARAAQSAMNKSNQAASAKPDEEEQKKLAMRKAIAAKLRMEVIDKH